MTETPNNIAVSHILDQLEDLYDRGTDEFASQQTWNLIAELVLLIPDNGIVVGRERTAGAAAPPLPAS